MDDLPGRSSSEPSQTVKLLKLKYAKSGRIRRPEKHVKNPEKHVKKSRHKRSVSYSRSSSTWENMQATRSRHESESGSTTYLSSASSIPSLSRSHSKHSRSVASTEFTYKSDHRTPSPYRTKQSPARNNSAERRGILRNKHKHFHPSVKLDTPPQNSPKKLRALVTPPARAATPPLQTTPARTATQPLRTFITPPVPRVASVPSCFPITSLKLDDLEDSRDQECDIEQTPSPLMRQTSTRLRQFELKRLKLDKFKARCFSDSDSFSDSSAQIRRRGSDDWEEEKMDTPELDTINVFEPTKHQPEGSDTIRFQTHIKFTCELFDKHMEDQYKGKTIEGKCIYNYWLFYQQVERFRKISMEIIEEALKSNDKQFLRDVIDDMKQEAQLMHNEFLNFDSRHRIHIEDKEIMAIYGHNFERCGRFARQCRDGEIQPHEVIAMFDSIQTHCIEEYLEQVFIDFCFFTMMNFIIPRKNEPDSPTRLTKEETSV